MTKWEKVIAIAFIVPAAAIIIREFESLVPKASSSVTQKAQPEAREPRSWRTYASDPPRDVPLEAGKALPIPAFPAFPNRRILMEVSFHSTDPSLKLDLLDAKDCRYFVAGKPAFHLAEFTQDRASYFAVADSVECLAVVASQPKDGIPSSELGAVGELFSLLNPPTAVIRLTVHFQCFCTEQESKSLAENSTSH